jgi:hypothetical protein
VANGPQTLLNSKPLVDLWHTGEEMNVHRQKPQQSFFFDSFPGKEL